MSRIMDFNDEVTLVRDGKEIKIMAYVQSEKKVFADIDVDAEEGDEFKTDALPGELVIKEVQRVRGPSAKFSDLNHATIVLMKKKDWLRGQQPQQSPISQVWNVGSAGTIAGRDINGPITINANTVQQILQQLEQKVAEDPTMPEEEKKTTLQAIRDLIVNKKVGEFLGGIIGGAVSSGS